MTIKNEPVTVTVRGWGQSGVTGADRYLQVVFTDPEGRWLPAPHVVALGPNGGQYADLRMTNEGDLERFALGILKVLSDKRAEHEVAEALKARAPSEPHEYDPAPPDDLDCKQCGRGRYHDLHIEALHDHTALRQFNDGVEALVKLGIPSEKACELVMRARDTVRQHRDAHEAHIGVYLRDKKLGTLYAYSDGHVEVRPAEGL